MGEPASDTRPPEPKTPIVFLTASIRALAPKLSPQGRKRLLAICDELDRHATEEG